VFKRLVIPSDFSAVVAAEETVLKEVSPLGYGQSSLFGIKLALEEGLNNAIRHGNRLDPRKTVQLDYEVSREHVVIEIADQGLGFDPQGVPDPTADENLEKPSGRGIMLMRAYMDEVRYSRDGKQLHMMKRRS
jgi:serine/threonine-protein kinase RsbW